MKKIRFGRTGVEVPGVGFGTWGHGGAVVEEGHPVGWSGHDDRAATDALLEAYRLGLNHWDTADVYGDGRSEELIGALWGQVERGKVFLASKAGWDPGRFEHPYHPDQMRQQLERSLRGLATETIDLYYFHRCDFGESDEYFDDAVELMHRFREEGKIRFIGLSDWANENIMRYVDRVAPDVVQGYRTVVDDTYESSGLKAWIDANDAGVAFFSPLRHGLLLGRWESPPQFGEGDHRSRIAAFRDAAFITHLRACREAVTQRFGDHPEPVLHALTGALLADSPTGCVLLGLRQARHARAAAAIGVALSPEDAAWVRELYRQVEPDRDDDSPW